MVTKPLTCAVAVVTAALVAAAPAHRVAPDAAVGTTGGTVSTTASRADVKIWEGLRSVGLTDDQRLVEFPVLYPDRARTLGRITGLIGDRRVVGIDYRVQDGLLYGVGDQGGVYSLDDATGVATRVSQLTVALRGSSFGIDFDPAADRLRIVSDTGQNLRHNLDDPNGAPAAGATADDGALTDPAVLPATARATALGVTGVGYTDNDLDAATGATLFDVDTVADRISLQSPADAGSLTPTGRLGVDAGPDGGFDVYFSPERGTNQAFAALEVGGLRALYRVDVLTGQAVTLGDFAAANRVVDLALPLSQT